MTLLEWTEKNGVETASAGGIDFKMETYRGRYKNKPVNFYRLYANGAVVGRYIHRDVAVKTARRLAGVSPARKRSPAEMAKKAKPKRSLPNGGIAPVEKRPDRFVGASLTRGKSKQKPKTEKATPAPVQAIKSKGAKVHRW